MAGTTSKASTTSVPATQETSTPVVGPAPAFKPGPEATPDNTEPTVDQFSTPGDVNAPGAKPSTDHRTVREYAEDLAEATRGVSGFHDSMSGRAVNEDGSFVEGEGVVPPHRVVANNWAEDRPKLDPKSAPVVQPKAVTEDQVRDSGTVELSDEEKARREAEKKDDTAK